MRDTESCMLEGKAATYAKMAERLAWGRRTIVEPLKAGRTEYSAMDSAGVIVGTVTVKHSHGAWWHASYKSTREYEPCGLCGNYEATHAQGTLCAGCYLEMVREMCTSAVRDACSRDQFTPDTRASIAAVAVMERATESVTAYALRLSSGQAIHRVRGKAVQA